MNDESRKRLTLYTGECWHEYKGNGDVQCSCGYVAYYPNREAGASVMRLYEHFSAMNRHTFTTYEDLGKLKDKLVENGEFRKFLEIAFEHYEQDVDTARIRKIKLKEDNYLTWLLNPSRFCTLVDEYLASKEGSNA